MLEHVTQHAKHSAHTNLIATLIMTAALALYLSCQISVELQQSLNITCSKTSSCLVALLPPEGERLEIFGHMLTVCINCQN